jgi:hypothetical protein
MVQFRRFLLGKFIDTLVEDINDVLAKGITSLGAQFISADIKDTLDEKYVDTLPHRPTMLRASNLGETCSRKLWYDINDPVSNAFDGRARFNFMYGDIIEAVVLNAAACAGHSVSHEQEEVEIDGVKGHIDAVIDGCLVDVKSTSMAFKFANSGLVKDDTFGYLSQLAFYLKAMQDHVVDIDHGYFLVVCKVSGRISLEKYDLRLQMKMIEKRIEERRKQLDKGTPPDIPKSLINPEHMADEIARGANVELPTKCVYCPHMRKCWPGVRGFQYSGRNGEYIKYFNVVQKHPKRKIKGRFVNAPEVNL